MNCPECQSEININATFCEYCGTKIPEKVVLPLMREVPIPEPKPTYPKLNYIPQYVNVKSKSQRIKELEKDIEENKNAGLCFTCCFYPLFPLGIYFFIKSAKLKKQLALLKEGGGLDSNGTIIPNNIYFIQNSLTQRIKIGMSTNVSKRLKQLQTGSDGDLRIVGIVENRGSDFESELHNKFRKERVSGEWFNPSTNLINYINSINNHPQIVNTSPNTYRSNTSSINSDSDTALKWKTAGMWFIFLAIGEIIWIGLGDLFGIYSFMDENAEFGSNSSFLIFMALAVLFVLFLPVYLAMKWNKKQKQRM